MPYHFFESLNQFILLLLIQKPGWGASLIKNLHLINYSLWNYFISDFKKIFCFWNLNATCLIWSMFAMAQSTSMALYDAIMENYNEESHQIEWAQDTASTILIGFWTIFNRYANLDVILLFDGIHFEDSKKIISLFCSLEFISKNLRRF